MIIILNESSEKEIKTVGYNDNTRSWIGESNPRFKEIADWICNYINSKIKKHDRTIAQEHILCLRIQRSGDAIVECNSKKDCNWTAVIITGTEAEAVQQTVLHLLTWPTTPQKGQNSA